MTSHEPLRLQIPPISAKPSAFSVVSLPVEEDGMAAYHIRFIKKLSDDHSETVYRSIVIRLARDAVRAVAAAKRRFERLEGITHWRLRADRMKIESPTGQATNGFDGVAPARPGHWRSYLDSRMNSMKKSLDTAE
jgi:hypothetical protein